MLCPSPPERIESIREAAQQIGIDDEKYFCRLFKKYVGMTTSEYKTTRKST